MWGIPMEIQPRAIKVNFALAKQPGFCTQLFAFTPSSPERVRAHLTASTEDGSGAHNPAQTFPKPTAPPTAGGNAPARHGPGTTAPALGLQGRLPPSRAGAFWGFLIS